LNRLRGTDYPAWNPETEVATAEHRTSLENFLTENSLNEDVKITYDFLGRKSQVVGPSGTTTFAYEGVSQRISSETGPYGTVSRTFEDGDLDKLYLGTDSQDSNYFVDYDFLNGRLVNVAYNNHSIAYNYVPDTNLVDSVAFNTDDLVSSRSYDDANRWTGISHSKKNLPANDFSTTTYTYQLDTQGRRTERTLTKGGEDFVITYGYNNKSEVISAVYSNNFPNAVKKYQFGFDEIGNRTLNRQNDLEVGGAYNALNQAVLYNYSGEMPYSGQVIPQAVLYNYSGEMPYSGQVIPQAGSALTSVTVDGQDAGLSGDLAGQVVVKDGKKLFVLAQDDQGRKSSVTKEVPNQKVMTYDLNGNLKNDGTWSYYWNVENRLVQMENAETRLVFEYDPQGRRVRKQVYAFDGMNWNLSDEKRFLYDGWNMIAELDGANVVERTFVWGLDLSGSMQSAGGVGGLLVMSVNGGSDYFYTYDANGNAVSYIDAGTLNVVTEYEYSPFGKMISGEDDVANPYVFSTKYRDSETDMLYYGFRYYDSVGGRWINRDPIGEVGGLNVYGFVFNSPINKFDYLGLAVPAKNIIIGLIPVLRSSLRPDLKLYNFKKDCKSSEVTSFLLSAFTMKITTGLINDVAKSTFDSTALKGIGVLSSTLSQVTGIGMTAYDLAQKYTSSSSEDAFVATVQAVLGQIPDTDTEQAVVKYLQRLYKEFTSIRGKGDVTYNFPEKDYNAKESSQVYLRFSNGNFNLRAYYWKSNEEQDECECIVRVLMNGSFYEYNNINVIKL
jgi:RHS repeat-associated protein